LGKSSGYKDRRTSDSGYTDRTKGDHVFDAVFNLSLS
jgi:hypothetical protein